MKTRFDSIGRVAKGLALIVCMLGVCITPVSAKTIEVMSGNTQALIAAINVANMETETVTIVIIPDNGAFPPFVFTEEDTEGSGNALPTVRGQIFFISDSLAPITFKGNRAFRFAEITGFGTLGLSESPFTIQGFGTQGMGGGILVAGEGSLVGSNVLFNDNFAAQGGGAVAATDRACINMDHSEYRNNHTSTVGGAIKLSGMSSGIEEYSIFDGNRADQFGCDLALQSTNPDSLAMVFRGNNFSCDMCENNVLIEHNIGNASLRNNTFGGLCNVINTNGDLAWFGNVLDVGPPAQISLAGAGLKAPGTEAVCNDFGIGVFQSQGYNISNEASCGLNDVTDLPNTDPLTAPPDADGIIALLPGSPAIDSGASELLDLGEATLSTPCGYTDIGGLGRPQDANLDGIFECDRGAYEVQGGPDIGAPQTAAYFATARNGEGAFVEILAGGLAVISFYTYSLDGTQLAWYMGLGRVVGNSIVIDEMQKVTGGVFGAGFDAASIVRTNVGGMSLVFPDCAATNNPGRLNFTVRDDSGLEHLLQEASRLTTLLNCDGSAVGTMVQRSGAFYAPARSGEGIFVQWLSDGRVVLVFYTFDPDGNPFWVISDADNTVVNGNTVTANMLYAQGKTRYGVNFDPAEVTLAPWGTVTLTYSDDNNLTFAYTSVLAGFGASNHAYTRLTQPLGTQVAAQGK